MGIAEQMGRTLQRTSISVNIKERLDFSCALFGPDGALVANAPHLPVHLGAMSEANRFQVNTNPCNNKNNNLPVCQPMLVYLVGVSGTSSEQQQHAQTLSKLNPKP